MAEMERIENDLHYVRNVVQKAERQKSPAGIYWLWAAIVLIGFALPDFAPRYTGIFWMLAGPAGGALSAYLGWRDARRLGFFRREEGIRHCLHWGAMMGVILLSVPLATRGVLPGAGLGKVILLLVTLAYLLAGVHLERPLGFIGIVMAAGYVALFFIPAYGWTVLGALVALSLVATALWGASSHATQEF
ncbi:MAG TPA: hypothetical protein VGR67_13975 [Candidatus Polarisedimenticolia bacterium]|jgi:hypothetical protein|nr:hypothetical protein [Candidatus Polarisedimenticolia bacterium]